MNVKNIRIFCVFFYSINLSDVQKWLEIWRWWVWMTAITTITSVRYQEDWFWKNACGNACNNWSILVSCSEHQGIWSVGPSFRNYKGISISISISVHKLIEFFFFFAYLCAFSCSHSRQRLEKEMCKLHSPSHQSHYDPLPSIHYDKSSIQFALLN